MPRKDSVLTGVEVRDVRDKVLGFVAHSPLQIGTVTLQELPYATSLLPSSAPETCRTCFSSINASTKGLRTCRRCQTTHYCSYKCWSQDRRIHRESGECWISKQAAALSLAVPPDLRREALLALRHLAFTPPPSPTHPPLSLNKPLLTAESALDSDLAAWQAGRLAAAAAAAVGRSAASQGAQGGRAGGGLAAATEAAEDMVAAAEGLAEAAGIGSGLGLVAALLARAIAAGRAARVVRERMEEHRQQQRQQQRQRARETSQPHGHTEQQQGWQQGRQQQRNARAGSIERPESPLDTSTPTARASSTALSVPLSSASAPSSSPSSSDDSDYSDCQDGEPPAPAATVEPAEVEAVARCGVFLGPGAAVVRAALRTWSGWRGASGNLGRGGEEEELGAAVGGEGAALGGREGGVGEVVAAAGALVAVLGNALEVALHPAFAAGMVGAARGAGGGAAPLGMYRYGCRINHSCRPSAVAHFRPSGQLLVRLVTDLPPGGEVSISYTDLALPRDRRRRMLYEKYGFECACERCCSADTPSLVSADSLLSCSLVKLPSPATESTETLPSEAVEPAAAKTGILEPAAPKPGVLERSASAAGDTMDVGILPADRAATRTPPSDPVGVDQQLQRLVAECGEQLMRSETPPAAVFTELTRRLDAMLVAELSPPAVPLPLGRLQPGGPAELSGGQQLVQLAGKVVDAVVAVTVTAVAAVTAPSVTSLGTTNGSLSDNGSTGSRRRCCFAPQHAACLDAYALLASTARRCARVASGPLGGSTSSGGSSGSRGSNSSSMRQDEEGPGAAVVERVGAAAAVVKGGGAVPPTTVVWWCRAVCSSLAGAAAAERLLAAEPGLLQHATAAWSDAASTACELLSALFASTEAAEAARGSSTQYGTHLTTTPQGKDPLSRGGPPPAPLPGTAPLPPNGAVFSACSCGDRGHGDGVGCGQVAPSCAPHLSLSGLRAAVAAAVNKERCLAKEAPYSTAGKRHPALLSQPQSQQHPLQPRHHRKQDEEEGVERGGSRGPVWQSGRHEGGGGAGGGAARNGSVADGVAAAALQRRGSGDEPQSKRQRRERGREGERDRSPSGEGGGCAPGDRGPAPCRPIRRDSRSSERQRAQERGSPGMEDGRKYNKYGSRSERRGGGGYHNGRELAEGDRRVLGGSDRADRHRGCDRGYGSGPNRGDRMTRGDTDCDRDRTRDLGCDRGGVGGCGRDRSRESQGGSERHSERDRDSDRGGHCGGERERERDRGRQHGDKTDRSRDREGRSGEVAAARCKLHAAAATGGRSEAERRHCGHRQEVPPCHGTSRGASRERLDHYEGSYERNEDRRTTTTRKSEERRQRHRTTSSRSPAREPRNAHQQRRPCEPRPDTVRSGVPQTLRHRPPEQQPGSRAPAAAAACPGDSEDGGAPHAAVRGPSAEVRVLAPKRGVPTSCPPFPQHTYTYTAPSSMRGPFARMFRICEQLAAVQLDPAASEGEVTTMMMCDGVGDLVRAAVWDWLGSEVAGSVDGEEWEWVAAGQEDGGGGGAGGELLEAAAGAAAAALSHCLARLQLLLRVLLGEAHGACEACQFLPFFAEHVPYDVAAEVTETASALLARVHMPYVPMAC